MRWYHIINILSHPDVPFPILLHIIQATLSNRPLDSIRALLLLKLFFKLGEFLESNLLLLIQHLLYTLDFLNIMHQHALNTVLEGHSTGIAGTARAPQLKHDLSVVEATELNVAAVFLDSGADTCVEEFLDHADDFVVVFVVGEAVGVLATLALLAGFCGDGVDDGLAGCHIFVDEGEDLGLNVAPGCGCVFGYGDVVGAEEDAGYAINVEELGGEGRWVGWCEGGSRVQVFEEGGGYRFGEDALVGVEL
jgi:hypothetical protein